MPAKQRKESSAEKASEKATDKAPEKASEAPGDLPDDPASPQTFTEGEMDDLIKKVVESDLLKRQLALMVEQMGAQIVGGLQRQLETKLGSIQAQVQQLQTTKPPQQSTSDMNDLRGEFHNLKQTVMETVTKLKSSPMPIPMNAPAASTTVPRRRG